MVDFLTTVAISLDQRAEMRRQKNFKKADEIRDWLKSFAWEVKDKADGGFRAIGPTEPTSRLGLNDPWTCFTEDVQYVMSYG